MHGASAAERLAAAELRARHAQHVAQDPEERRVAVHIDAAYGPVDFDSKGHGALSLLQLTASVANPRNDFSVGDIRTVLVPSKVTRSTFGDADDRLTPNCRM
jgi:hypothetical protein